MSTLEPELNYVNQKSSYSKLIKNLDSNIAEIEKYIIGDVSLKSLQETCKNTHAANQHCLKEHYHALNRLARQIETFDKPSKFFNEFEPVFVSKKSLIDRSIALHFAKVGLFDLIDLLKAESGTQIGDSLVQEFKIIQDITNKFKSGNIEPILDWVRLNIQQLVARDSNLEYNLYMMQYFKFIKDREPWKALSFARTYFQKFVDDHLHGIQQAICALLFQIDDCQNPYRDLFDNQTKATQVLQEFLTEFSISLNLSLNSPIYDVVDAAILAIPLLAKRSGILKLNNKDWASLDDMAIEIDLPGKYQYHSIFTCPVSKEQSSEKNPPVIITCGHVISKESYLTLSKGAGKPFKCPYCPIESQPANALTLRL